MFSERPSDASAFKESPLSISAEAHKKQHRLPRVTLVLNKTRRPAESLHEVPVLPRMLLPELIL